MSWKTCVLKAVPRRVSTPHGSSRTCSRRSRSSSCGPRSGACDRGERTDDVDRVTVVDGDVEKSSGGEHPMELEQPGVGELGHVGEDAAGEDHPERAVGHREVGERRGGEEPERRREMLVAPVDVRFLDVGSPDVAAIGDVGQPTRRYDRPRSRSRGCGHRRPARSRPRARSDRIVVDVAPPEIAVLRLRRLRSTSTAWRVARAAYDSTIGVPGFRGRGPQHREVHPAIREVLRDALGGPDRPGTVRSICALIPSVSDTPRPARRTKLP